MSQQIPRQLQSVANFLTTYKVTTMTKKIKETSGKMLSNIAKTGRGCIDNLQTFEAAEAKPRNNLQFNETSGLKKSAEAESRNNLLNTTGRRKHARSIKRSVNAKIHQSYKL